MIEWATTNGKDFAHVALLMFDNWVPSLNIPYSLYTGLLLTTLLF